MHRIIAMVCIVINNAENSQTLLTTACYCMNLEITAQANQ